jgi:soluble lytic murein transglycosylase-like protein
VALLEAVGTTESADDPTAVSVTGAEGVMQLEPATAAAEGVTDPWNPTENILGGAEYLAQQLATFHGNLSDAIAAYNAGPGAVEAYGGIPPYAQTQAYVTTVLGHYTANLTAEGATSL